jgi:pimeloyl-ACP methyl ester carboxylesterase
MVRERSFAVNGLTLAAIEWPREGLPIIALHGWLDNAASFIPLAEHLAGYHLLALELPGHGRSGHLPAAARYHLADNLHWLAAVADAMGWQRFLLLGHSMGAAIATLAAAAMPQRVIALGLIDGLGPLAFTPRQEVDRLRHFFATGAAARSSRPFADPAAAARARMKHSRYPISLAAATVLSERNLCREGEGYAWCYDERLKAASSHYYSEEQVRGILATIECPSLLLSAEQGALAGWEGLCARRDALTGLQVVELAGGHHLHMERPDVVAMELLRFYATLEGAGG